MKVDGGCHCGFITYEADIDPETVGICHCTDCQTFSGGAFRTGGNTRAEDFKLLSGELKKYVKTAESGARRAQMFCPECGTHIYATTDEDEPKVFRIRVSTTRQRNDIVPKRQGWFRSAQKWVTDLGSIPSSQMQR